MKIIVIIFNSKCCTIIFAKFCRRPVHFISLINAKKLFLDSVNRHIICRLSELCEHRKWIVIWLCRTKCCAFEYKSVNSNGNGLSKRRKSPTLIRMATDYFGDSKNDVTIKKNGLQSFNCFVFLFISKKNVWILCRAMSMINQLHFFHSYKITINPLTNANNLETVVIKSVSACMTADLLKNSPKWTKSVQFCTGITQRWCKPNT